MAQETQTFKNFAFISYSHADKKSAKELQKILDEFHLPIALKEKYPDCPEILREIFRDDTGLPAGSNLTKEIQKQLDQSNYLIVICSPNAVKSHWVNKEIEYFKIYRDSTHIIPFIIEGVANAKNDDDDECFPSALKSLETRGANISTFSFERAVVEVIAGALEIDVDDLWQRHVRAEEERKRELQEQRDNLLRIQSRFLAEKAISLVREGNSKTARLLALKALPKDLSNPDRPYVAEAEKALRFIIDVSVSKLDCIQIIYRKDLPPFEIRQPVFFSPNGKTIISTYFSSISFPSSLYEDCPKESIIRIWGYKSGELMNKINSKTTHTYATFSPNGKYIVSTGQDAVVNIWDRKKYRIVKSFNSENNMHIDFVVFSRNSSLVIAFSAFFDSSFLQIWDIETDEHHKVSINEDEMNYIGKIYPDIWHVIYQEKHEVYDIGKQKYITETKYILWDSINRIAGTPFGRISISPDLIFMATINNHLITIYTNDGNEFKILNDHKDSVRFISFSPDGSKLVSTSNDKTIKVWDVASGTCIKTINESSFSAIFSPDGEKIVSVSHEGTIHVLSFTPLQQLIDEYSHYRYGQFTPEERKKYYLE